jgi:DNA polymerase II small subunit
MHVHVSFDDMKKKVLQLLTDNGILADPEAADLISRLPDPVGCVEAILKEPMNRSLILTKEEALEFARKFEGPAKEPDVREVAPFPEERTRTRPVAQEDRKVIITRDITGDSTCVGNVIDFAKLFKNRYATVKKMLARRRELSGLIPISRAKKVQRDVRFVGIVNDLRATKNGHTLVEVEDESDKIQVLVMKGTVRTRDSLIKDEVVGIAGSFSRDGEIVIAKEVVRPDVPLTNPMEPNGSESVVAFVSDTHVGSDTFLPEKWGNFMSWLKKDPLAMAIGYIVMPGDLVDGIGIYPGQEDELLIEDVYEQYEELANLVKGIPDRIKVIMIPGNHDAVRLAEPQPALPKEIRGMFDSGVMFAGNPCYLDIEGRSILVYHGRSIDDLNANIPNLSYDRPTETMREMLRRRHLAPIYGEKTAIAPEQKDYLVIDKIPNIFVTGHVHKCSLDEYRGIKLINASAWQSQTEYQRMHNQIPDPAKVPMIDLGTGDMWVEDFSG